MRAFKGDQRWLPTWDWDYSTGLPQYSLEVHARNHYTAVSGDGLQYFAELSEMLPHGIRMEFQRFADHTVIWLERRSEQDRPDQHVAWTHQAAARTIAILRIWSRDLNRNHDLQPINEWYRGYLENPQRYWGI